MYILSSLGITALKISVLYLFIFPSLPQNPMTAPGGTALDTNRAVAPLGLSRPSAALPQPDAGVCSALSTRPLHGAETPPGRRPRGCRHHPRWLAGTRPGEVAPRDRARGQDVHPGLCCPLCPVPAAVVAVRPVEGVPLLGLCAMGVSARE